MVDDKERQKLVSFLQEHPKTFFSPKTLSKKLSIRKKHVVKMAYLLKEIRLALPREVGSMKHKLTLLTLH